MSKVYLEDSTLTNIANAIRAKAGNSTQLLPSEMPAAITALPSGGGGGGGIPEYYIPIPAANEYSLGRVGSGTPLEYNWIKIPSSASKSELDVTILGFDSAEDFLNRCVYFAFAGKVQYQPQPSSSKLQYNKIILPWLRNDYQATDASYNTPIDDFFSKNSDMIAYGTVSTETYGNYSTSYDSNFGPGVQDAADIMPGMPGCIGILHYDGFAEGSSYGKSVPYAFEAWALNSTGIITFWEIRTQKGSKKQAAQHTDRPFVGGYYVDVISLPRKEN